MDREKYVEASGEKIDIEKKYKDYVKRLVIILGSIIFIILLFIIFRNISRNNLCNELRSKIKKASLDYSEKQNIKPKSNGDFIEVDLKTLIENDYLKVEDITVNENKATGKIKITKYDNKYMVTIDLDNCDYCSTYNKKWKESKKEPKKGVVDVVAYYNYKKKSTNYTNWTDYLDNDKISKDVDKKYSVRLPIEETRLPRIPTDAKIEKIEAESKEYYRYRDKKWRFYNETLNYTSFFSSEQPAGYSLYDNATLRYTEWSKFSLNYPEKKTYRSIESKKAYKWYYMDGKKKIYYKNGEYAVEPIGNKKYIKDSSSSATMYRYRDKEWRWYNGTKRRYSRFSSIPVKGYNYRDDDLFTYSGYSGWYESSQINNYNNWYREEEISTRYRYRIKYYVLSMSVLDKPVTKEELENNLNQNIDEILKREDLKVEITYKYKYK